MQNEHTRKMNRKLVTQHMKILFGILDKPCPKHIIYVRSPKEAQYVANYLDKGDFSSLIRNHNYTNNYSWVSDAVKFCKRNKMELDYFDDSNILLSIGVGYNYLDLSGVDELTKTRIHAAHIVDKYTCGIYLFSEVIILSHKPTKVILDDNDNLTFAKFADGHKYSK